MISKDNPMLPEQPATTLVNFSDGTQSLVQSVGGMQMSVQPDDATIVDSQPLTDMESAEAMALANRMPTKVVHFDTINRNVSTMPKEKQTKTTNKEPM